MKDYEIFATIAAALAFGASVGVSTMYSALHARVEHHTVAWMKDQEEINRLLRKRIELLEQLGTHLTDVATGRKK